MRDLFGSGLSGLGEQKIDIIGDHEENSVVREALKNGMELI